MKQSFLAFSLLVWGCICSAVEYDQGERRIIVEGPAEKVENVEIVVPEQTRLLKFTARELSTILRKATGREIPVTSKPTEGRFSIFLGDNSYSRKAGLAVERLPEGGFYILRSGNSLYLAGLDSGKDSPEDNRWGQRYPKRTLTAAYDFLERFAGVRFYFPGEIGTVIPKRSGLFLPRRINILDRPDLIDTSYYSRDPQWYDGGVFDGLKGMTLDILRYRMSDFCSLLSRCLIHSAFCIPAFFISSQNVRSHRPLHGGLDVGHSNAQGALLARDQNDGRGEGVLIPGNLRLELGGELLGEVEDGEILLCHAVEGLPGLLRIFRGAHL